MGEPRSVLTLLVYFAGVLALAPLALDLFGQLGLMLFGESLLRAHGWLWTVVAYVPLLLLVLVFMKASLDPLSRFGLVYNKMWLGRIIAVGVVAAFTIYSIDIVFDTLAQFGAPPTPSWLGALGYLFAWGLLAPFTEELLFRGGMQTLLAEKLSGAWPAILIATGLELFWHLSVPLASATQGQFWATVGATLPQLGYVAVFGTIGGYVYYRTRSLLGPVLIHALGNGGELLLFWLF
jgi:membrane protease YdiL (CAAX protease family)